MTKTKKSKFLTVVIPTFNEEINLPKLLRQLKGIDDIIIVDAGSSDKTCNIGQQNGAKILKSTPNRGKQMLKGFYLAKKDWILFLHADSKLPDKWNNSVEEFIKKYDINHVGWFYHKFNNKSLMAKTISKWANLRSNYFNLPFGDQGILISKIHYKQIGGHPPIPIMEDIGLINKINPNYIYPINGFITTSYSKYNKEGAFIRGIKNLTCQICFFLGLNPSIIKKIYL